MDNYNYYFTRGNKKDSYNFDLETHMKNFDLYEFSLGSYEDKYGFLVIKNDKYLIGYNARFGKGTHLGALARVMKEELGGGIISNEEDAVILGNKCLDKYITANLINEYRGKDYLLEHENKVYMCFSLEDKIVNNKYMKVFTSFYNDYNKEIKFLANHFGFKVYFTYYEDEMIKFNISNNLDNIYNFLDNKNIMVRKRIKNG